MNTRCPKVRSVLAAGLILALTFSSGCTTTRPVAVSPAGLETIRPGNLVRVVTKEGEAFRFGVVEVTPTRLIGESVSVELAEIERIDRREFSGPRTAGLVTGIAALVGLVIYAISQMTFVGSDWEDG